MPSRESDDVREDTDAPCDICGRGWPYHAPACSYAVTQRERDEAIRQRDVWRRRAETWKSLAEQNGREARGSGDHDPPRRLIDPEGEGVYMLSGQFGILMEAARDLLGDVREWRRLVLRVAFMRPKPDSDEWIEFKPRAWDWWKRKRNQPVVYLYCTPPIEDFDIAA